MPENIPDCPICGAPYDYELIEGPEFDEDGELVEPAEFAYFPMCDCKESSDAGKDAQTETLHGHVQKP